MPSRACAALLAPLVLGAVVAAAPAGVAAADLGPRMNYLLHCSGCHQPDGAGSAAHNIPRMKDVVGHFLRTPEGRAFLVQVPGTANSGLGDAQVAELLNWMLPAISAAQLPADFQPYSTAEVSQLRARRLADVAAQRQRVVQQLRDMGYAVP
jgi:mono/diheme cytochrome c family protein